MAKLIGFTLARDESEAILRIDQLQLQALMGMTVVEGVTLDEALATALDSYLSSSGSRTVRALVEGT
jgi:hypothetical protein